MPLISIIYIVLVHNYNTIKYICFIRSRQRAGMSSRENNNAREREHPYITEIEELTQQALNYADGWIRWSHRDRGVDAASTGLLPPARTKSITSQQINSSK